MTPNSHGPLPSHTARMLTHLPERVRIVWPHHRLTGAELEVHGWLRIDGEVHLRMRLPDGSIGCLPMSWTSLSAEPPSPREPAFLSLESLRTFRQFTELLLDRRHGRGRRETLGEGQS
jgi:hypothetical protein